MGACREMRLPRSESESQSMSPSAALDSLADIQFKWLLLLADFQSRFAVARPAVTSRGVQV